MISVHRIRGSLYIEIALQDKRVKGLTSIEILDNYAITAELNSFWIFIVG